MALATAGQGYRGPTYGTTDSDSTGYPNGSSGFSNLLLDLKAEPWMELDDYGEAAIWKLPVVGVEVFLDRESSCDTYILRRIAG